MPHISAKGFTLPEVIVTLFISSILMTLLFTTLDDLYRSNTSGVRNTIQTADTRAALRKIAEDVTVATNFYATNTTDPVGPIPATGAGIDWIRNTAPSPDRYYSYEGFGNSGGSSAPNGDNRILILGVYALDKLASEDFDGSDPLNPPTRQVVLGADCLTPIENNIIYFLKIVSGKKNLYKRTVQDKTTPKCASQVTSPTKPFQTCPTDYTNAVCNDPGGNTHRDALVIKNVEKFSINYYQNPNDPGTIIAYPGDPTQATAVEITLRANNGLAGNNLVSTETKLMLTRINGANT